MIQYYLSLGFTQLKDRWYLSLLMMVVLGVGVASSVVTLTILYHMSGHPIPHKNEVLLMTYVDGRDQSDQYEEPNARKMLSYPDVMNLMAIREGIRKTPVYATQLMVEPKEAGRRLFFQRTMAVDRDFFRMFEVPFIAGGAWSSRDNKSGGRVVVLRESLAYRLLGKDVVRNNRLAGSTVRMGNNDYSVVGVVSENWKPSPRYYRLINDGEQIFSKADSAFVPFSTAITNSMFANAADCFKNTKDEFSAIMDAPHCTWIQFWAEVASPAEVPSYKSAINNYVTEQRKMGRFPGKDVVSIYNVSEWLAFREVVTNESFLQTFVAFGFLLVCIVNTVGILLAKFIGQLKNMAIRRALGASQRDIFFQYITQSLLIGLGGAVVGLFLSWGLLSILRAQSSEWEVLAQLNATMLLVTLVTAMMSSVLAGVIPAYRACRVLPATMLRS